MDNLKVMLEATKTHWQWEWRHLVDDEIFKTLQEKGKCVDDEIDEKNHKPISCAKNSSNFITTEIENDF